MTTVDASVVRVDPGVGVRVRGFFVRHFVPRVVRGVPRHPRRVRFERGGVVIRV